LPFGVIRRICSANTANHANAEQREIERLTSTAGNNDATFGCRRPRRTRTNEKEEA